MERWAERRGVLMKSLEDAALVMAGVYRSLRIDLPEQLPFADEPVYRRFADLLTCLMPFDLILGEQTTSGGQARVAKTSVCGS